MAEPNLRFQNTGILYIYKNIQKYTQNNITSFWNKLGRLLGIHGQESGNFRNLKHNNQLGIWEFQDQLGATLNSQEHSYQSGIQESLKPWEESQT